MNRQAQSGLFRPSVNDSAVVTVAQGYSELLSDPRYSAERKDKLAKLKRYAQELTGADRELVKRYWPDLLTNNPKPIR